VEIKRLNMTEPPSYSLAWTQTDADIQLSPSYPKSEMDVLDFQRNFVANGSWGRSLVFRASLMLSRT